MGEQEFFKLDINSQKPDHQHEGDYYPPRFLQPKRYLHSGDRTQQVATAPRVLIMACQLLG